jgi:hypothetical protein
VKFHLKIGALLMMFLFLAACSSAPERIQITSTNQVDVSTSTVTPKPSLTIQPTKSHTPVPTVTNTPWVTKDVLAQFGMFGGDGGWDYYAFIGGQTPKWILYTDGQFVIQREDAHGVWFEETHLATSQMCSFLSQVEKVGFFTLAFDDSSASQAGIPTANPVYKFDNTTQFSEGGPYYVLQVNGSKHRQLQIYSQYVQYLVPGANQVFNFFANYSPPSNLTKYQAQFMLLRIEEGLGESIYSTPTPNAQTWPTDLPSLDTLKKQNIETEASSYFSSNVSQALVTGEMVKPIFKAFGNRLAYRLFKNGEKVYYAAARPLLPHETLNDFSGFPREEEFDLPFSCSN